MTLHAASALEALSDDTRRAILDRLREGEQAVGELATGLPVTRPAVSQHLKVLRDAGLVVRTRPRHAAPVQARAVRTGCRAHLRGGALGRHAGSLRRCRTRGAADRRRHAYLSHRPGAQDHRRAAARGRGVRAVLRGDVLVVAPRHALGVRGGRQRRSRSRSGSGDTSRSEPRTAGRPTGERSSSGTRRGAPSSPGIPATRTTPPPRSRSGSPRKATNSPGWTWSTAAGRPSAQRAEATREGYDSGWNTVFAVRFGAAAQRGRAGRGPRRS